MCLTGSSRAMLAAWCREDPWIRRLDGRRAMQTCSRTIDCSLRVAWLSVRRVSQVWSRSASTLSSHGIVITCRRLLSSGDNWWGTPKEGIGIWLLVYLLVRPTILERCRLPDHSDLLFHVGRSRSKNYCRVFRTKMTTAVTPRLWEASTCTVRHEPRKISSNKSTNLLDRLKTVTCCSIRLRE